MGWFVPPLPGCFCSISFALSLGTLEQGETPGAWPLLDMRRMRGFYFTAGLLLPYLLVYGTPLHKIRDGILLLASCVYQMLYFKRNNTLSTCFNVG
jgi:hypothetical protein